jgi:hypothetical protein
MNSTSAHHTLERPLSHGVVQHQLSPDAGIGSTWPQLTASGPPTDAFEEASPTGLVNACEAEAELPSSTSSTGRRNSHTTLVGSGTHPSDLEKGGKAVDVKLVTWLENDPENPYNWGLTKKWYFLLYRLCLSRPLTLFSFLSQGSNRSSDGALLPLRSRILNHHRWSPRDGCSLPRLGTHHVRCFPSSLPSLRVVPLFSLPCPTDSSPPFPPHFRNFVICVFVVGFGIGPLVLSPLSESAFLPPLRNFERSEPLTFAAPSPRSVRS